MNAHIMGEGEVALTADLPAAVAEYEAKLAAIPEAVAAFEKAGEDLKAAACVQGEWGHETINTGNVYASTLETSLRRSAWWLFWKRLNLPAIASAKDKEQFERAMANPPPFDLDTLRATFGPYLENPRLTILRGMAEVFSGLDPAYKSHEKVKIGVKGLPKRVILTGFASTWGRGADQCRDILNALAAYQGKPLVTHHEMRALENDGSCLRDGGEVPDPYQSRREREASPKTIRVTGRGVWLKRFQNGNGHLFFGPEALRDINMALAEYYGDVLADCPEADAERPAKRASTEVARDLQFYGSTTVVIERLMAHIGYRLTGKRVLEPSCGDGRLMEAVRKAGALDVIGVEYDSGRAQQCREKGFVTYTRNFLETDPGPHGWSDFDMVVMNPPFYGRHYAKHVRHAIKFLKPGGMLVAILPATARYDHGELDDLSPSWNDLPLGAFSASGTRICTTMCTIWAPKS